MIANQLTSTERRKARKVAQCESRRQTPRGELSAERHDRVNLLASYAALLELGDQSEDVVTQLRGGIEYESMHIHCIDEEFQRRANAVAFGYREGDPQSIVNQSRFDAVRDTDCALVMQALTGQQGKRTGDRTLFACPFHTDSNPSLTTYPGDRGWFCFVCQIGGDAVRLIAEFHCIGMGEALLLLESGELGVGGAAA